MKYFFLPNGGSTEEECVSEFDWSRSFDGGHFVRLYSAAAASEETEPQEEKFIAFLALLLCGQGKIQ